MATTIEQVAEALEASGGFITEAAKKLGVTYYAVSKRVKRSSVLQAKLAEIVDRRLDFAESQLLQQMKNGNMTAIIFYLKCKGKERGYIERQEIDANIKSVPDLVIE